jgi:hypothetical protein
VALYRQRVTAADDFLLRVVFPCLASLHITPALRFARFWLEPIAWGDEATPRKGTGGSFWGRITPWTFVRSTSGTFPRPRQSRVNVPQ